MVWGSYGLELGFLVLGLKKFRVRDFVVVVTFEFATNAYYAIPGRMILLWNYDTVIVCVWYPDDSIRCLALVVRMHYAHGWMVESYSVDFGERGFGLLSPFVIPPCHDRIAHQTRIGFLYV